MTRQPRHTIFLVGIGIATNSLITAPPPYPSVEGSQAFTGQQTFGTKPTLQKKTTLRDHTYSSEPNDPSGPHSSFGNQCPKLQIPCQRPPAASNHVRILSCHFHLNLANHLATVATIDPAVILRSLSLQTPTIS
ncbi:hypothetical protein T492DRAFT_1082279 [Pavlovales sp. CCMP2436]|nr:hypothetical protein T492DRAFT_1082279 [Pavlovales sp. CCMP2436]